VISGVVNQADLKKQIEAMMATAEKAAPIEQEKPEVAAVKRKASEVSSVPS
jgi:hypothetical protein